MPQIYKYKCSKCDLTFPDGWGGYTYVTDDKGDKVVAPHPVEAGKVSEVLGREVSWDKIYDEERVGFNSYCICKDCSHQFEMDLKKEDRKCPQCQSDNVSSIQDLVGQSCPKCKEGTIEATDTGTMS